MTGRWRAFLDGVASINLWGTPSRRLQMPSLEEALAGDADAVWDDMRRATGWSHVDRQGADGRVIRYWVRARP